MKTIRVEKGKNIPQKHTGIVEWSDGDKWWLLNGQYHREDGPAIEHPDGSKYWYLNGKCHREDGPAIVRFDGSRLWHLNGGLHREDGPAVEWINGSKEWWQNDKLLFKLPLESQPFVLIEEFVDEEGKEKIKVLTQGGVEIWSNLPGLEELADNWEKK